MDLSNLEGKWVSERIMYINDSFTRDTLLFIAPMSKDTLNGVYNQPWWAAKQNLPNLFRSGNGYVHYYSVSFFKPDSIRLDYLGMNKVNTPPYFLKLSFNKDKDTLDIDNLTEVYPYINIRTQYFKYKD